MIDFAATKDSQSRMLVLLCCRQKRTNGAAVPLSIAAPPVVRIIQQDVLTFPLLSARARVDPTSFAGSLKRTFVYRIWIHTFRLSRQCHCFATHNCKRALCTGHRQRNVNQFYYEMLSFFSLHCGGRVCLRLPSLLPPAAIRAHQVIGGRHVYASTVHLCHLHDTDAFAAERARDNKANPGRFLHNDKRRVEQVCTSVAAVVLSVRGSYVVEADMSSCTRHAAFWSASNFILLL